MKLWFPGLLRLDAYQRLTRYLQENLDYEEGVNLFPFAWDWRRDLRKSDSRLGELIHQLREDGVIDDKVIFNGAFCRVPVARYYVERMGGRALCGSLDSHGWSHSRYTETFDFDLGRRRLLVGTKSGLVKS